MPSAKTKIKSVIQQGKQRQQVDACDRAEFEFVPTRRKGSSFKK
jgi:hypothetical protein